MERDDFYLQVSEALCGCQLVEQELKLYITEALLLVKKVIGKKVVFRMSGQDYENSPLGQLIKVFTKLSDNETLAKELRQFTQEQNFLSHRGIAHCLDWMGDLDESRASDFRSRLDAIRTEAMRLRVAVHEEANKFRGHLYFDTIPERQQ